MTVTCFVRSRHGISSLSEEKREREGEGGRKRKSRLCPKTTSSTDFPRRRAPPTSLDDERANIPPRGAKTGPRDTRESYFQPPGRRERWTERWNALLHAVVNALESWLTLTRATGNGVETGSDGDVFPEREAVNPSSRRSWMNNGRRAWLLRGCRRHCRKQRLGNP